MQTSFCLLMILNFAKPRPSTGPKTKLGPSGIDTLASTRIAGLEGALRSEAKEKEAGAAPGPPRTAGDMLLRPNKGKKPPAPETHQVTQHATRGAAKRAASEKPKPRKRAKAEAAFGNEQAPLLGLDVYQKDEADLRERALGSPICIVRGLLPSTPDDPFALPTLRRDHGATRSRWSCNGPWPSRLKLPPPDVCFTYIRPLY